jgi:DeoR/GlpR family transcriptional regulator of sugar metabolism
VGELASELQVSTETIRRDLDELKCRGSVNRTYGGAVRPFAHEAALTDRHSMLIREREAIARGASGLIKSGEVVLIGSGATTLHVARRIAAEHKDITAITHCFDVISVLATNPSITAIFCRADIIRPKTSSMGRRRSNSCKIFTPTTHFSARRVLLRMVRTT